MSAYILKVILISSIIYLFYRLFLQKETFFQSIRWYFIIGIIVSLFLPLLIIPIYIDVKPIMHSEFTETINNATLNSVEQKTAIVEKSFNWVYLWQSIYLVGAAFFSLKFIWELLSLIRIIAINRKRKECNYYIIEADIELSPFSFFNYIVVNKKNFNPTELTGVIEHEKVHVEQKHSIDTILVQLFLIIQWFNPFVWLYKKELQQNLEYIADKKAQNKAKTYKEYQYLLLKTSIKNSFALSNNFFNSQLKKRIMMLQKSQTQKINQLKYLLLLPLIALFLYSFNTKEVFVPKSKGDKILISDTTSIQNFISPIIKKKSTKIMSGYGMRIHPITKKRRMHKGVDFSANKNTNIFASDGGVVVKAEFHDIYGKIVYVNHKNGFQTRYAHMNKILVKIGDHLKQGAIIGLVGSTGKSVAPHLHFEILKEGNYVNPVNYLIDYKEEKPKKHSNSASKYSVTDKVTDINFSEITIDEKEKNINSSQYKVNKGVTSSVEKEYDVTGKLHKSDTLFLKNKAGTMLYKSENFYFNEKHGIVSFYNKYGVDISGNLFEKLREHYWKNISKLPQAALRKPMMNSIQYENEVYFYIISAKRVEIFNRHGKKVDIKLSEGIIKLVAKKHNFLTNELSIQM